MLTRTHNLAGICIGAVGKSHCQRAGRLRQSRHNFVAAALPSGIVLVHWLTDSGAHSLPPFKSMLHFLLACFATGGGSSPDGVRSERLCRSNTL